MDKKILDFPEAAELANDDYIIFDSESGGGCRILAKKIAPVILGIEAIYTQTQEVHVDTPLNDLKQDLVVKAVYRNNRKKVVTDYELSGTLSVGTSVITVTYSNQTTTFEVEVTQSIIYLYNWDFKESLVDKVKGRAAILGGGATRTNNGVEFTYNGQGRNYLQYMNSSTAESENLRPTIDQNIILEIDFGVSNELHSLHKRLFMWDDDEGLILREAASWEVYQSGSWNNLTGISNENKYNKNLFGNSTAKFVFTLENGTGYFYVYKNDVLIGSSVNRYNAKKDIFWYLGSSGGSSFYDIIIEGVRIYSEPTA